MVIALTANRDQTPPGHRRSDQLALQRRTADRCAGVFGLLSPAAHLRLVAAVLRPLESSQRQRGNHTLVLDLPQADPEGELILVQK